MLPPEFELTLAEQNEIQKGINGKKFAKAEDATICDSEGQIHIKFPTNVNHRNAKRLHGTYEQIVQYLFDMYPPLEPDCPRIHKGVRGSGWNDAAVDLYVDRRPVYPGKDINRIAALLKKHKKVFIEDSDTVKAVRAMFPFISCQGKLLFYEKSGKPRKPDTRRANRVKKGLVGWWEVRLLYDEYLNALNGKLYHTRIAAVERYRWPATLEAYAERVIKFDAFFARSGIRLDRKTCLTNLKKYIPGLLKRPEPFWRKFGRWLKKRTSKR